MNPCLLRRKASCPLTAITGSIFGGGGGAISGGVNGRLPARKSAGSLVMPMASPSKRAPLLVLANEAISTL